MVFIFNCICICISLIWKYAVGGKRSGVDFVSLSLSSSPPLQLFRRRRPVATLCIMNLCILCFLFFIILFFCQDLHFWRIVGILSALTLFLMHHHTSPREGLPYPPTNIYHEPIFEFLFFVFAVLSHICAEKCSLWRSRWCGFRLPLSAPLVHSSIPAQRNAAFLRSISSERYLPPCSPSQLHVNVNICNHMQL